MERSNYSARLFVSKKLKADMKYPVGPDVKTNQYQKAISQEVNLVEVEIYIE